MESRQTWNRHSVLAQAFYRSDDQSRAAQTALEETEQQRALALAAFAVSIGNDRAVANLLGLNPRDVRLSRRSLSKADAKRAAKDLLDRARTDTAVAEDPAPSREDRSAETSPAPSAVPPGQYHHYYATQSEGGTGETARTAPVSAGPAHAAGNQHPHQGQGAGGPAGARDGVWTPSMDRALIDSWRAGIDLRLLVPEFGFDLSHLIARVQQLFMEGVLAAPGQESNAGSLKTVGRHRRYATPHPTAGAEAAHGAADPRGEYHQPYDHPGSSFEAGRSGYDHPVPAWDVAMEEAVPGAWPVPGAGDWTVLQGAGVGTPEAVPGRARAYEHGRY